jgi:hypothetical protein
MNPLFRLIVLGCIANPFIANATSCVRPTPVEGLVRAELDAIGKVAESFIYIYARDKYEDYLFKNMSFIRVNETAGGDIFIDLKTEQRGNERYASLMGKNHEIDHWQVIVLYEKASSNSDICKSQVSSGIILKHNKLPKYTPPTSWLRGTRIKRARPLARRWYDSFCQ